MELYKGGGFQYSVDSPFATVQPQSLSANSSRKNSVTLGGALRRSERFLKQLQTIFGTVADIVPTIDFRSQTLNVVNVADRKSGIVLPVNKIVPVDHDQVFTIVSEASVPHVLVDALERTAREATIEAT